MTNTEVLSRLRELHDELTQINSDLDAAEKIDDATQDALGQLVTDVGVLMERVAPEQADSEEHQNLLDRITKFNSENPKVRRFLSQITDVMVMFGL